MATDADTVVFVGPVDVAGLTGRSAERIYQLVREIGTPGSVLAEGDALVNGGPVWRLESLIARLGEAGYRINTSRTANLRRTRTVPTGTVPLGVDESAEVLGLSSDQFRNRTEKGNVVSPLFQLGRKRVWDLAELIVDAEARGYAVDRDAAERWRTRNGGSDAASSSRVVALLRLEAAVTSRDLDLSIRSAKRLLENPEVFNSVLAEIGLRVVAASVESVEATPL